MIMDRYASLRGRRAAIGNPGFHQPLNECAWHAMAEHRRSNLTCAASDRATRAIAEQSRRLPMKQIMLTGAALLMGLSSTAFADNMPARNSNAAVNPPAAGMPATATMTDSSGVFANVAANEQLSSKVVGLEIYNNANQNIGKIKD